MPKKISTKCNVFLQLIILRPHPHFTRHVRKKNPQNHLHFTRLKIRKSAFYQRPLVLVSTDNNFSIAADTSSHAVGAKALR